MMEETVAPSRLPFWATSLGCALILLVLTLPRVILAGRVGLIADEAYYAVWSLNPGINYYDHPPIVAWTIWLGRMVLGESEFAVRAPFLILNLITCAALYHIGELCSGDRRVGAAAAIGYAVVPGVLLTFSVATPDGPSVMFWVLSLWAVTEFVRGRNPNWWLLAGAFAGFGLLSKYTVAFLGVGLLFYLLTSRERIGWLRHWQVWAGAVLAVVIFSPTLWIASQSNWATFRFQLDRSSLEHPASAGVGELIRFLTEESLLILPTASLLAVAALVLFFARGARPLAPLVLTSAPMAVYFLVHAVFGRVNPNWTAPLFPVLVLLGAWVVFKTNPVAWLRWSRNILAGLHIPLGIAVLATGIYAVSARGLPFIGPLPFLGYVYGWDDFERKISATAKQNGAQWVDIADYGLNGMVAYYARIAHDPLVVSNTVQAYRYQFRPPLDPAMQAVPHLIVRAPTNAPPPDGATRLPDLTRDFDGQPLSSYEIFLVK
jgi:4-amino-4-deoxy-L-arabinose transferase-like glycosyltransferase